MNRKATRYLIIICASAFIIILALLHVIKPELDPSWRVISEYEIGHYGWIMQLEFFLLTAASIGVFATYWHKLTSKSGRAGLIWLLISAFGMIMGGTFVTDPITTVKSAWTTNGILHNMGGAIMIFSTPFVITLITMNLIRQKLAKKKKLLLIVFTVMVWLGFIGYIAITALTYRGIANPEVVIGWPNRIFILGYSFWLIIAAWPKLKNGVIL